MIFWAAQSSCNAKLFQILTWYILPLCSQTAHPPPFSVTASTITHIFIKHSHMLYYANMLIAGEKKVQNIQVFDPDVSSVQLVKLTGLTHLPWVLLSAQGILPWFGFGFFTHLTVLYDFQISTLCFPSILSASTWYLAGVCFSSTTSKLNDSAPSLSSVGSTPIASRPLFSIPL